MTKPHDLYAVVCADGSIHATVCELIVGEDPAQKACDLAKLYNETLGNMAALGVDCGPHTAFRYTKPEPV